MGFKRQIFLTEEFQIVNIVGMKEIENEHKNTTCYSQDPLIDANISR